MEFDYDKFVSYLMQFFLPFMAIFTGFFIWAIIPAIISKNSKKTPFTKIPYLLGREKETIRLVNKIKTGQSAAIIGIFSSERTELLNSLDDFNHYGDEASNLIFSKQDISILETNSQPEQFWRIILEPLRLKIFDTNKYNNLKRIYSDCQSKNFDNPYLDKLFEEVKQANLRVVLLLDRFHDILNKPNLNQETFLGKLRSLSSSMNPSPLCLVITAHESLRKLHEEFIKEMPNSTSPFLNFMNVDQITLGALSESDIDIELKKLKLSKKEQEFIKNEVGQHPYLINIAYNRLKEAEQVQEPNPIKVSKQDFKEKCRALLDYMLRTWSSQKCQVFVQIAQDKFNNLNDYKAELEEMKKQGLIQQLEKDQWQVFSPMFVELLKERDTSKLCPEKTK